MNRLFHKYITSTLMNTFSHLALVLPPCSEPCMAEHNPRAHPLPDALCRATLRPARHPSPHVFKNLFIRPIRPPQHTNIQKLSHDAAQRTPTITNTDTTTTTTTIIITTIVHANRNSYTIYIVLGRCACLLCCCVSACPRTGLSSVAPMCPFSLPMSVLYPSNSRSSLLSVGILVALPLPTPFTTASSELSGFFFGWVG